MSALAKTRLDSAGVVPRTATAKVAVLSILLLVCGAASAADADSTDAFLSAPAWSLAGEPAAVRIELRREDGAAVLAPVVLGVEATEGVSITAGAGPGEILSGEGSARVEARVEEGAIELSFLAGEPGRVFLRVTDPEGAGIRSRAGVRDNLELPAGGWLHGGPRDPWSWGVVDRGPAGAPEKEREWSTSLGAPLGGRLADGWLLSPLWRIPASVPEGSAIELRYRLGQADVSSARVEVATGDGRLLPLRVPGLSPLLASGPEPSTLRIDAAPLGGRSARLRFSYRTIAAAREARGFAIAGARLDLPAAELIVLAPRGDEDGDGLANGVEREGGTSPLTGDSDGDGAGDALETAAESAAGPRELGTDPLRPDSDGGGFGDGREWKLGLDPLDPNDDPAPVSWERIVLEDAEGFPWSFSKPGAGGDPADSWSAAGFTISSSGASAGPAAYDLLSRTARAGVLVAGPAPLGELELERAVVIPARGALRALFLDTYRNPTAQEATARVEQRAAFEVAPGSRRFTSSGDASFSSADRWVVFEGDPLQRAPHLALVVGGASGLRPVGAASPPQWTWDLTLPPGGEAAILSLAARCEDLDEALAEAEELSRLAGVLGWLPPEALAGVVNFPRDRDGDFLPDDYEAAVGLDPGDPEDGAGDLDGDGLANLEEYRAGTDPRRADSDGDGLGDLEEARGGSSSPTRADSDGDGAPDGSDPRPDGVIEAFLDAPRAVLRGEPFPLSVRLEPREALAGRPVRISLELREGSGRFAPKATAGRIVAAPAEVRVELETTSGEAAVAFTPRQPGLLLPQGGDPVGQGIRFVQRRVIDFEEDDGGFHPALAGRGWSWGAPGGSAPAPRSGTRDWGTDLEGDPLPGSRLVLDSPELALPDRREVRALVWQWWEIKGYFDATVSASIDSGPFRALWSLADARPGSAADEFQPLELDLSEARGRRARFRFTLAPQRAEGNAFRARWYLDDFTLEGSPPLVAVLSPEGDADADGRANAEELVLGTDPLDLDSDEDGLPDGVETATGVRADPADLGTDPLREDSDGGGTADGEENRLGFDPLDPRDDLSPAITPHLVWDAEGYGWTFDTLGNSAGGSAGNTVRPQFNPFRVDLITSLRWGTLSFASGDGRHEMTVRIGGDGGDNLDVVRRISVSTRGAGFVRYLEAVHNTGVAPVETVAHVLLPLGPVKLLYAPGEEDPSAGPEADGYVLDDDDPSGDAFLVLGGGEGTRAGSDGLSRRIQDVELSLAPGETAYFLHFEAWSPSRAEARAKGRRLLALGPEALAGLPPEVVARTLNAWVDADGDGMSDHWEKAWGLDPARAEDGGEDPDADGVSNLEEFRAGTRPDDPDTDHDGLPDPREAELGTSATLADSDRDGALDGVDPYPRDEILATILPPARALVLVPAGVRVVTSFPEGEPALPEGEPGPSPRFTLLAEGGSVTFAPEARRGRILARVGDAQVEVEAQEGVVEVDLVAAEAGEVAIRGVDSSAQGIAFEGSVLEDFEVAAGGWSLSAGSKLWRHGPPAPGGPRAAPSGRNVWEVRGSFSPPGSTGWGPEVIVGPPLSIPGERKARLEIQSWSRAGGLGTLALRREGVVSLTVSPEGETPAEGDWGTVVFRLPPEAAGRTFRPAFRFNPRRAPLEEAWAIDDIRWVGLEARLPVLDGSRDEDGDGLDLAAEIERGSDDRKADTDGDGLADAVETGTGVYVGPGDTGTDPAAADTDGAGADDGFEITLGTDPFDAADDVALVPSDRKSFRDGQGFFWSVGSQGRVGTASSASSRHAFELSVNGVAIGKRPQMFLLADGREVLAGPFTVGSVEVLRSARVPAGRPGFVRLLDRFRNLSGEPGEITVQLAASGGTYRGVALVESGDREGGATYEVDDRWLLFDDLDGEQRPAFLLVTHGPGARARPARGSLEQGNGPRWEYDLSIPGKETVSLLHFAAQDRLRAASLEKARDLLALRGEALAGIPPAILPTIVNFAAPPPGEAFVRGDADHSGRVEITDAVRVLDWLFRGGPEPEVLDAADADDDGRVAISDPIRVLTWLFQGGEPPPPPFLEPGFDPTSDEL